MNNVEITFNCEYIFDDQFFRKDDHFVVPVEDAFKLVSLGVADVFKIYTKEQ
jgi:hypothetical protein